MKILLLRRGTGTAHVKDIPSWIFVLAFWADCSIIQPMAILSEAFSTFRAFVLYRFPWRLFLLIGVIILLAIWMLAAPDGVLGKADAIGYAVCHRIDHRSFHIGDYQFSVCARCAGQYLGAVLGMVFLVLLHPRRAGRPSWMVIVILGLGALGYAIDGTNSFLYLISPENPLRIYVPNNYLRLATGTMVGLGLSTMLFPAFNQTIWKRYNTRPVMQAGQFSILLALAAILNLLVHTGNPLILYPLSLISAGGVLMLLTMVYTMVWIMIFRLENHFEHLRQIFYPLLAGFAVALLQILLIDGLRFWLTRTWGGFPLG
jgi:uncharacterized membrane protein